MQSSPLDIEWYYVESLRWELSPDFRGEAKREPLRAGDLTCDLQRADLSSPRAVAFRLSLEVNDAAAHDYIWKIVLVGHFRLSEIVPDEQVEKTLDANAPALLYSAAREAIATALGRGPAPAPLLPSVNFLNLQSDQTSAETSVEDAPRKATKTTTAKSKAALPAAKKRPPRAKSGTSKAKEAQD